MAVDQSTGEVYVSSSESDLVDAFEASGTPDPTHPTFTEIDGTTPFPFMMPSGLAVDNSAGPNKHDIYVADFGAYGGAAVLQFNPTGIRTAQPAITVADVPNEGSTQPGGLPPVVNNLGFNPAGVAVASNGDIYVADLSNNVIDVFEPNGTFVSQFGSGVISNASGMTFGPAGDLYVANGSGTIEFEPSGSCVNSCTPIDPSGTAGVTTDPEGDVYADEGGKIAEFTPSGRTVADVRRRTIGDWYGRRLQRNQRLGLRRRLCARQGRISSNNS